MGRVVSSAFLILNAVGVIPAATVRLWYSAWGASSAHGLHRHYGSGLRQYLLPWKLLRYDDLHYDGGARHRPGRRR